MLYTEEKEADVSSFGVFVVGVFRGVSEDKYPRLLVRTGEPSERSPEGYVERLSFSPYHPVTGERTIDAEVKPGDVVAVEVTTEVAEFTRDGVVQRFVGKRARSCVPVARLAGVTQGV